MKRVKLEDPRAEEEELPGKLQRTAASGDNASGVRTEHRKCPYLDTINRHVLDFDFDKACSVTLSRHNVYACLVCGKFFQGRGRHTPAYTHALQASHYVFMNLRDARIWCLPDNYEVVDSSLRDVQYALDPSFTDAEIAAIDGNTALATDLQGIKYLPGFVGLNNLKKTDYLNVVVHVLCHVNPLRDFFLKKSNYAHVDSELVATFGQLVRKIWSPRNFKSTVSPHELMVVVSTLTKKRFQIGHQADAMEFLSYLLNSLHQDLIEGPAIGSNGKPKKVKNPLKKPSIITRCFRGEVEVSSEKRRRLTQEVKEEMKEKEAAGAAKAAKKNEKIVIENGFEVTYSADVVPFLFLSLELPPTPLFKDEAGGNVIPQVPLYEVLQKFDGVTKTDFLQGEVQERRAYRVKKFPPFLLLHFKRFAKNNFFLEKNPTIVTFPIKNLELRDYVDEEKVEELPEDRSAKLKLWRSWKLPRPEAVKGMSISDIKDMLAASGSPFKGIIEKEELVKAGEQCCEKAHCTKYDLVANVCHDSPPETNEETEQVDLLAEGSYRCHVLSDASRQWYEIQDLHVEEAMPQLISLSESYMTCYRNQAFAPAIAQQK